MYRIVTIMFVVALGVTARWAYADPVSSDPFPLSARSAEEFRGQAEALRTAMRDGRYASLPEHEKGIVIAQLERLEALYARHEAGRRVDTPPATIAAINASEIINVVLGKDGEDRIVCEQVKKAGSNRIEKYCATVRQRRLAALGSQKEMHRWYSPKPNAEGQYPCEYTGSRCFGGVDGLRDARRRVQ
ncbi:hypothetical protein ACQQ2N_14190 [Dokdonella sp. MW10]|uniref:hypothetical protein n=1 Tax=Dokdonella sp. MW10 TaxID=2992926 RepID=UPI003F7D879C